MSRESDTDTVASAAISRASMVDRGVVVKTTKYDIEPEREKLAGWGRVTCRIKPMKARPDRSQLR